MSRMFVELEDMGFSIQRMKEQNYFHCKHEMSEGYYVPMVIDDLCIKTGLRCKKCGCSGELRDYINKFKPNFMDYDLMVSLK